MDVWGWITHKLVPLMKPLSCDLMQLLHPKTLSTLTFYFDCSGRELRQKANLSTPQLTEYAQSSHDDVGFYFKCWDLVHWPCRAGPRSGFQVIQWTCGCACNACWAHLKAAAADTQSWKRHVGCIEFPTVATCVPSRATTGGGGAPKWGWQPLMPNWGPTPFYMCRGMQKERPELLIVQTVVLFALPLTLNAIESS